MSVDTYLKGKNLGVYTRIPKDGVEILISPRLNQWAQRVSLRVTDLIVRKWIRVEVEHNHDARCGHR